MHIYTYMYVCAMFMYVCTCVSTGPETSLPPSVPPSAPPAQIELALTPFCPKPAELGRPYRMLRSLRYIWKYIYKCA